MLSGLNLDSLRLLVNLMLSRSLTRFQPETGVTRDRELPVGPMESAQAGL